MKRSYMMYPAFLLILMLAFLLPGCRGMSQQQNDESAGSITVAGSTSVQPFSEVLAEEFMAQNPNARVNVQGGGSSQGIEAAMEGVADIGASSRELKKEEKRLHEILIARDGIVVVVHPSNPISNLTMDQVKKVFLGEITNWKQLGGNDGEITLVSREAGSGTRDGFESLALNKQGVSDKALIANSTGAIRMIVAGDKDAIGYISLAVLDYTVKPLKIDGVDPTAKNIANGSYPINRPFIYLTREEPSGLIRTFIDFVLSKQGQSILVEQGAVAVRPTDSD